MIDSDRVRAEGFGCDPVNPAACQTCKFMTGKRSVHCLVYSADIGVRKPEAVYNYGKPCEHYSKKD